MDRGTENVRVAEVQYAFREYHSDEFAADKSFRFGTSPANIVSAMYKVAYAQCSQSFSFHAEN